MDHIVDEFNMYVNTTIDNIIYVGKNNRQNLMFGQMIYSNLYGI